MKNLTELAAEANKYHAEVESQDRTALEAAWHAGQALNAAKDQVGHGKWGAWLKDNFSGSARSAQEYMQLDSNTRSSADLAKFGSISAALKSFRKSRPKDDKPPAAPVTRDRQSDKIVELGEQKVPRKKIAEEVGVSERTVRRELELEALVDAAAPVDWDSIPGGYQAKLERAKKTIRREVEQEVRARLLAEADQFRAAATEELKAFKEKLEARANLERANRDKERARYKMLSEVHSGKGLITPNEYKLIRSCLHPDTRMHEISDLDAFTEKLNRAFDVFNDPKVRALLVKEEVK